MGETETLRFVVHLANLVSSSSILCLGVKEARRQLSTVVLAFKKLHA